MNRIFIVARIFLTQGQRLKNTDFAFWIVFVLGFATIFSIALFCALVRMPWRRWLPGAESAKSFIGAVRAAVYSFMSYTH
jgi:light-harvesting complex 1 beta chain